MLKGSPNFRLLYGYGGVLTDEETEAHIQEVVEVFMRAYRAD